MRVEGDDDGCRIVGTGGDVETVNEFLAHLGHLNYSGHTVRA